MKQDILNNLKAIALGLILTAGMSYVAAQTASFTGPKCAPPGCNTAAPLNVSDSQQQKTGPLTLLNLFTSGLYFTPSGVTIADGQVLTDDGTTGKVKWGNGGGGIVPVCRICLICGDDNGHNGEEACASFNDSNGATSGGESDDFGRGAQCKVRVACP